MPTPKELLAAAITDFTHWRKAKSHSSEQTPESLRQQAVALLEHFPFTRVTTTLKLSSNLLRRWSQQQPVAVHEQQPNEFITLPPSETPKNQLALELVLGNGCQMRLSGDISTEQLNVVTQNILMHQGATR
jgi:hypothetical protein